MLRFTLVWLVADAALLLGLIVAGAAPWLVNTVAIVVLIAFQCALFLRPLPPYVRPAQREDTRR